ncbi:MAG: hypothetical protein ACLUQ2_04535 [Klebsiella pneumoniae]
MRGCKLVLNADPQEGEDEQVTNLRTVRMLLKLQSCRYVKKAAFAAFVLSN